MTIAEKLSVYETLLKKWAPVHNLVSTKTLEDIPERHFNDSEKLLPFLSKEDSILDLGSGAGFPGLILAIHGFDITLIEADSKKCLFLDFVSRETKSSVKIINDRIENISLFFVPTKITARALAPLKNLIHFSLPFSTPGKTVGLFLKGREAKKEISDSLGLQKKIEWCSFSSENGSGVAKVFF